MRTSLNPARLGANRFSFLEYVDLAARHKFSGVDFSINAAMEAAQTMQGVDALKAHMDDKNIAAAAWGLPVEWRKGEDILEQGMAALREQANFASRLGATRCVTWMPPSVAGDAKSWERQTARRFGEIANILNDEGIWLGLEWVGPHHLRAGNENAMGNEETVHTLDGTRKLIEQIGQPMVGLLVDCYHCFTTGIGEAEIAALPEKQIVHVHINDAPKGTTWETARDGERVLPGTGVIDVAGFLRALRSVGYTGFVAAEVLAKDDLAPTPDEAADRVMAAMLALGV